MHCRSLLACLVAVAAARPAAADFVVDFEDLTFAPGTDFENGANLSPPGRFTAGGAGFNNNFSVDPDFGSFWSGWSYSRVTDLTTPGFTNQYAAYHVPGGGTGDGSPTYAVAFSDAAAIDLPADTRPLSVRLTNTTYAALSMQTGDMFAKRFGGPSGDDPDFFAVTISGRDAGGTATGSVEFFLADYRFADNSRDFIVDRWTTVDLSGLGAGTRSLAFAFASSDVGEFGINTPLYVAADNLTLAAVPEPSSLVLAGLAAVGAVVRRQRRAAG